MSSRKKRKKKKGHGADGSADVELNIMPFIDVFSILNTFLLMSSVSLAIGLIEVQIPFLSSETPPPSKPERSLQVKVDMEKEKISVISSWSLPPTDEETKEFQVNEAGIAAMHKRLVELRQMDPKADRIELFTEDDVIWDDMAKVMDGIKLRQPGDPVFPVEAKNDEDKARMEAYLFPKVVLASVILR